MSCGNGWTRHVDAVELEQRLRGREPEAALRVLDGAVHRLIEALDRLGRPPQRRGIAAEAGRRRDPEDAAGLGDDVVDDAGERPVAGTFSRRPPLRRQARVPSSTHTEPCGPRQARSALVESNTRW